MALYELFQKALGIVTISPPFAFRKRKTRKPTKFTAVRTPEPFLL